MKRRIFLFMLGLICWATAAFLTWQEWQRYQQVVSVLPPASVIAGIPAGGLTQQEAATRLAKVYLLTPVQVQWNSMTFNVTPQQAGVRLALESMFAKAAQMQTGSFVDFLQNHPRAAVQIPLEASVEDAQISAWLNEQVKPPFQSSPAPAYPIGGTLNFAPGQSGEKVYVDQLVPEIHAALLSPSQRSISIPNGPPADILPPPPDFKALEPMLGAFIQTFGYQGTIELYLQDLKSGQEINIAYAHGQPVTPGIAFTGASTIKIPVMVAAFHHTQSLSPEVQKRMELMIEVSDNASTDDVMKSTMDVNLAPLQVTEDMQALGLQNTFLAGYFAPGAPFLKTFVTPGNQRKDITTAPDPYNQTTPAEMGRLLAAIQQCADNASGPLFTAFKGEVSQDECKQMLAMLQKNRKAVLVEGGLPEGTVMAHKYGWVIDPADGLMHTLSDAAIVYHPAGNYVLTVYLYDADQLLWDPAQNLVAYLTVAVEHYYDLLPQSGVK